MYVHAEESKICALLDERNRSSWRWIIDGEVEVDETFRVDTLIVDVTSGYKANELHIRPSEYTGGSSFGSSVIGDPKILKAIEGRG